MKNKIGVFDNRRNQRTGEVDNPEALAFKNQDSLSVLHKDLETKAGYEFEILRKLGERWNAARANAQAFSIDINKEISKRGSLTIEDLQELEEKQKMLNRQREKAYREYLDLVLFYLSRFEQTGKNKK